MGRPAVADTIRLYEQAKTLRSPYENDWKLAALYCAPSQYKRWNEVPTDSDNGSRLEMQRRYVYDGTGIASLPKWVAVLNRICTPENQRWQMLKASDPSLMKQIEVRTFFDQLNLLLFQMRYDTKARFVQSTHELYRTMGLYGMGPNSVMKRKKQPGDIRGGFSYKAWGMYNIFVLVDDEGNVSHIFRRFWLNARQAGVKFPREQLPNVITVELDKAVPEENKKFQFFQCLYKGNDYDANALDVRRHPVRGSYVCVDAKDYVGEDEGFRSFPMLVPRTSTDPEDIYGFSSALMAMPALGGLSTMKKTILKAGHKAVSPPLLANDDGVLGGKVDQRPDAVNYGGLNKQGQKMIQPMDSNPQAFTIAEKLMEGEQNDVQDAFLVTLFQMITESKEMTAEEITQNLADRAALVAPTKGRMQSEQLGPMTEREIDLLIELGEMPPMPPALREARGQYDIQYTTPFDQSMYSEEVLGTQRWLGMLYNHDASTQTKDGTVWANMDEIAPDLADKLFVPVRYVKSLKQVQADKQTQTQAQQQQQVVEQAPAIASVANAAMKTNGSQPPGVSNG